MSVYGGVLAGKRQQLHEFQSRRELARMKRLRTAKGTQDDDASVHDATGMQDMEMKDLVVLAERNSKAYLSTQVTPTLEALVRPSLGGRAMSFAGEGDRDFLGADTVQGARCIQLNCTVSPFRLLIGVAELIISPTSAFLEEPVLLIGAVRAVG